MASKEVPGESVVSECARQLRAMGDLIHWRYLLLNLLAKNYRQMQTVK